MVFSLKRPMEQVQIQKSKQKIQVPYIYSNTAVTEGTSTAPGASSAGATVSTGANSSAAIAAFAVEDLLCGYYKRKFFLPSPDKRLARPSRPADPVLSSARGRE